MTFPSGIPITVKPAPTLDVHGDPDIDEAERVIEGCAVAPRSSEPIDELGRAGVIIGLTLFAPPGSVLRANERITILGYLGTWVIEGEPGAWRSPYSGKDRGVEVALRRSEG